MPEVLDPNVTATATATTTQAADTTQQTQATTQTQGFSDPNATTATTTQAESWTKSWLKEDGTFDHKALEKAPDEFKKGSKTLGNIKTIEDMAKTLLHAEGMLGKKGIVEPLAANATDAEKAERSALLRKINGAPDKPEGYGIDVLMKDVPENMRNTKLGGTVAAIAHKYGVPPDAIKEMVAAQIADTKEGYEGVARQEHEWFTKQDTLIREVAAKEGLDFSKASDLAQRAGRKFGISPENPVMKNASVLMALARIGRAMGEDHLRTGDVSDLHVAANIAPADAEKAANSIVQDKNNALYADYWNRDNKVSQERHRAAVEKVTTLRSIAHAGGRTRGGR